MLSRTEPFNDNRADAKLPFLISFSQFDHEFRTPTSAAVLICPACRALPTFTALYWVHEGVLAPVTTISVSGAPAVPPEVLADPEAEALGDPPVVPPVHLLLALTLNCRPEAAQTLSISNNVRIGFCRARPDRVHVRPMYCDRSA